MRWTAVLGWRLPPRSRRWRLVLPGAHGHRGDAGGAGELGFGGKAPGAGDLVEQLAGRQRPGPGLGEQLRRELGDEFGDLGLRRVGGGREFAQAPQLVAGDADASGLLGARRRCAIRVDHFFETSALDGRCA